VATYSVQSVLSRWNRAEASFSARRGWVFAVHAGGSISTLNISDLLRTSLRVTARTLADPAQSGPMCLLQFGVMVTDAKNADELRVVARIGLLESYPLLAFCARPRARRKSNRRVRPPRAPLTGRRTHLDALGRRRNSTIVWAITRVYENNTTVVQYPILRKHRVTAEATRPGARDSVLGPGDAIQVVDLLRHRRIANQPAPLTHKSDEQVSPRGCKAPGGGYGSARPARPYCHDWGSDGD